MKLMAMHKTDNSIESSGPVDPKVVQSMGALIGEMLQKGVFLGGEGLKASATRARVTARGGERTIEKGPYPGRNELIAGTCLLRSASLEEALGWGGRMAQALGDGAEVEVGPVTEPWDLGAPKPSPLPPPRFLALAKSDTKSESGDVFLKRIAGPIDEMKRAGVLITAEGLAPSSQAKRVTQRQDRRKIVDGPFIESKELIGGFSLMQVASWDEALEWCDRFARVFAVEVEMDLRPLG